MGTSSSSLRFNQKSNPINLDLNQWVQEQQYNLLQRNKKINKYTSQYFIDENSYAEHRKLYVRSNCYVCEKGEYIAVPHYKKQNIQDQIQFYRWRKYQKNLPLVKIYGARCQQISTNMFCSSVDVFRVMTQKIEYRLHDFEQADALQMGEIVYMLSQALIGFCYLYRKFGPFQVKEDQIGINSQGLLKVWANSNFAQNHPSNQKPILKTTKINFTSPVQQIHSTQTLMIQQLLQIFKNRFPSIKNNEKLVIDLKNGSLLGFEQTFNKLQAFCEENKIFVPNHLQLVINQEVASQNVNQTEYDKNIIAKKFPTSLRQRLFELLKVIDRERQENAKNKANQNTRMNTNNTLNTNTRINTESAHRQVNHNGNQIYIMKEDQSNVIQTNRLHANDNLENSVQITKESFYTGVTGITRRTTTDRFMETANQTQSRLYQPNGYSSFKNKVKFNYNNNYNNSNSNSNNTSNFQNNGNYNFWLLNDIPLTQTIHPQDNARTYLQAQILKNKSYGLEEIMSVDSRYMYRGPSENFQ